MTATAIRAALRCDRPQCICKRARTVHCPAHPDRSPSFVVDQAGERLLVYCHGGCDQNAVIAALQARQLWPEARARQKSVADRRRFSSPLDEARREILQEARRQLRRLEPYRELFAESDSIRIGYHVVAQARRVATAIGDRDEAWNLLADAARLETATQAAEFAW